MNTLIKIQDSFNDKESTADLYWNKSLLKEYFKQWRTPMINNPEFEEFYKKFENAQDFLINKFKLKGFQFGNWVTNEDRFNYLCAMYICFLDMNKILMFKNNIGLNNTLAVAFGSRGIANAKAHFEPFNQVINISRYMREDVLKDIIYSFGGKPEPTYPKDVRFFITGGLGSFAHEYGHFLDFMFGFHYEKIDGIYYLTGKRKSVSKQKIAYPSNFPMRNTIELLFQKVFWKNGKKSAFSIRLENTQSDYINNRQEVFARIFEQYIHYKLNVLNIENKFMVATKYERKVYLTPSELKAVVPILNMLVKLMKEKI